MSESEARQSKQTDTKAKIYGQKKPAPPIRRLLKAAYYSLKGLKSTFWYEQAFRFEVYALIAAIPLSTLVAKTALEYLILIGSIIFVMIIELLNTGIEMIVDRVGVEHHELSGRAKDAGSAAVFVAMILAAACWLVIGLF